MRTFRKRWTFLFVMGTLCSLRAPAVRADDAQRENPLFVQARSLHGQLPASNISASLKAQFENRWTALASEQQALWQMAGQVDSAMNSGQDVPWLDSYNARVNAWQTALSGFNGDLGAALQAAQSATPPTAPVAVKWANSEGRSWTDGDQQTARAALNDLKEGALTSWIGANVRFSRHPDDAMNTSALSTDGKSLKFKDEFFDDEKTPPALRENLIAFEAGKAFFLKNEDRPIGGHPNLETWFQAFTDKYPSIVEELRAAKHGGDARPSADMDHYSQFADVFRGAVLPLDDVEKWDGAIQEFQAQLKPLLKAK